MIFLILNAVLAVALIAMTFFIDRYLRNDLRDANAFLVPLLLVSVESVLLTVTLFFKDIWLEAFIATLLKVVFSIDAIFFVTFSIGIISFAGNTRKFLIHLIQLLLIIAGLWLVWGKFEQVSISNGYNITIGSDLLFSGEAAKYFPFTWVDLFDYTFKGLIPIVCYIFLILLQEKSGNPLQRNQGFIIGLSFVLMWALSFFFKNIMPTVNQNFSSLFIYPYLAMIIVVVIALRRTSVPSGKSFFTNTLQSIITYIIPAIVIGAVTMIMQNKILTPVVFNLVFALCAAAIVIFSLKINQIMASSQRMHSADYATALENDLGSMNYNGEMDEITGKMNSIFRKNVESSSMNVYVLNNKGMLETAYSSNNFHKEIPVSNPIFDELLNIEKSVVIYSEIGHVHSISQIDDKLTQFFEETNSDALFLLNEGRNILGLITLGKRISGDHYKEYDLNVFNKLYSYFFVFGYYMRNISNKEIISVVNREIRMSSQIITSIQENIDPIKNPKVDTGYLMVPARNIGGEFIDLVRLTDTRHLLIVGDLSGKGIAASMNMVILKSIIRTYLAETHDFKELVVKINLFIRSSFQKGTIFAGLFALIDFETDTMYYINCGVPTLMLYTQVYNNVIEIQGSGHILGFVKDIGPFISVKSTKLNPGDIILACTDGLVQSHSLRGEQFGKERIQQCVLDNSTYPAQRMAQFTFDSLKKFMSKEMEDDVSILVLKYETKSETDENDIADAEKSDDYENPVVSEEVPAEEASETPESTENLDDVPEIDASAIEKALAEEEVPAEEKNEAPENFDMNLPEFNDDEIKAAIARAQAEAAAEEKSGEDSVPAAEVSAPEVTEEEMFVSPVSSGENTLA